MELVKRLWHTAVVTVADADTPTTRAEWVDARLRRAILTGALRADERLRAEHLAAEWGVSATPVREAFQRLAGEGWVTIEPQRGARVAPIERAEAVELYEIRQLLEPRALRAAMAAATPEYHLEVRAAHARLRRRGADAGEVLDAHRGFHLAVFSACPNGHLVRIITQLHDQTQRYHVLAARVRRRDAAHEHDRLAEAVLAGDVGRATTVLVDHLQATVDALLAD